MKRTFHFLLLIFCISTSASAQNYYDVSEFRDQLPELKQTDLVNFSKKDTNAFVTSCSLDTVSRILYYYHCYGGLFSYQPMSKPDMNAILAKKITPFEYFDLVTTFNVNLIEKAKKNLEDNGSNAKFTSLEKQYLDIADSVKFPSTLTKLLELDKQMVNLEVEDTRFHSVNPKYIKRDRSYYKTFNDLQGQMVIWRLSDSIATFYSKSDEPPVYKAVLDLKKAVICFYNRSDSLIDKIEINKNKVALLASKESDVFALYRMWLEWKRQSITQAIEETKKSGRVAEKKQYALNVLSEQVKMLSAIDYKIEYFTNADKQFVLQKLRRQFGAIFAPNDPWETGRLVYHTRGDKRYELTDHRGNVMAVISDMKRGVPRKDNPALVDHYEAIVLGATDYTPFGNPMQGRSFNSDKYPYGYNGKEDDNETGYENYGMRIYDPKVARFLSVDPLKDKFAYYSPYQFAGNSPIAKIDLDGLEPATPGSKVGETQTGTNGNNDIASSWTWAGKSWEEATLSPVAITAKRDNTRAAFNNAFAFNYTQAGAQKFIDQRATAFHRLNTKQPLVQQGDDPQYVYLSGNYKREFDAEESYRSSQLFSVAIITAPIAGVLAPELFTFSTKLWGAKATISWSVQAIVNGPKNVDYADVAADAVTAPGLGALINGSIDWTPFADKNKFRIVGLNKSLDQFTIDAGSTFLGGVAGDASWRPLRPLLKNSSEKAIFYFSTQTWIFGGTQGITKVIDDKTKK